MDKVIQDNNFAIAPVADFCRIWQRQEPLQLDWYLQTQRAMGVQSLILDSVLPASAFSATIVDAVNKNHMQADFVLDVNELLDSNHIESLLEEGHTLTVLLYKPLTAEFIDRIQQLKPFIDKFRFVLMARKDWNARNTFRSIPHFMRARLYVDFPASMHPSDAFFKPQDSLQRIKKLSSDFFDQSIKSFCPNLRLYNSGSGLNIKSITSPRKFLLSSPKLTIIATSLEDIFRIANLKQLQSKPGEIEVLWARLDHQPLRAIPTIKGMSLTVFEVSAIDPTLIINKAFLQNYMATQADANLLYFIREADQDVESIILAALDNRYNYQHNLSIRNKALIVDKSAFLSVQGFDSVFRSPNICDNEFRMRLCDKLNLSFSEQNLIENRNSNFAQQVDYKILLHKHLQNCSEKLFQDKIHNNDFVASNSEKEKRVTSYYRRQALKDRYLSLFANTPKVMLMGHFAFLAEFLKPYVRRVDPRSYKLYWKIKKLLNPKSYPLYWSVREFVLKNIWRFNPKNMKWMFFKIPAVHRLRDFVLRNLWRLEPKSLGWLIYRYSFPLRKVYYFLHYQYEKRILGLHQKNQETGPC